MNVKGILALWLNSFKLSKLNTEVQVKVETKVTENPVTTNSATATVNWEIEEVDILINAVKQYPGGTSNCWDQITPPSTVNFPTSTPAKSFTLEQVIAQAAQLQSSKDTPVSEDNRDEAQTLAAPQFGQEEAGSACRYG